MHTHTHTHTTHGEDKAGKGSSSIGYKTSYIVLADFICHEFEANAHPRRDNLNVFCNGT